MNATGWDDPVGPPSNPPSVDHDPDVPSNPLPLAPPLEQPPDFGNVAPPPPPPVGLPLVVPAPRRATYIAAWVGLGVLLVALIAGLVFGLVRGDDGVQGDSASSRPSSDPTTTPRDHDSEQGIEGPGGPAQDTTTTLPPSGTGGPPENAPQPPATAPPPSTDNANPSPPTTDSAPVPNSEFDLATQWIETNFPNHVSNIRAKCMAGKVIMVVGFGPVEDANGDLRVVERQTNTEDSERISVKLRRCLDDASLASLQAAGFPWLT